MRRRAAAAECVPPPTGRLVGVGGHVSEDDRLARAAVRRDADRVPSRLLPAAGAVCAACARRRRNALSAAGGAVRVLERAVAEFYRNLAEPESAAGWLAGGDVGHPGRL